MRDLLSENVRLGLGCSNVSLIVDNAASSPLSGRKTQEERLFSPKRPLRQSSCTFQQRNAKSVGVSDHSLGELRWDQDIVMVTQNNPNQAPPVAPSRMMSPFVNSGRKSLNIETIQQPQRKPSIDSPLKHKDSFYRNRARLTHTVPPSVMSGVSSEQLSNAVEQALIICDTKP
jgi:hypothetical protein